jgi:hypothetical protein
MTRYIVMIPILLCLMLGTASAVEEKRNDNGIDDIKKEIDGLKERIDEMSGLGISGFFDVKASNYKNNPNAFALGDFEFDIERAYKENIHVAAALVFNDEGAELAVGFIDYHFYGSTIAPRGRLFAEKGIHLQAGRFDVPFGNDWQYFASADRIAITPPLTTELVMDGGYNDVGVRFLANFVSMNMTIFMLRGIEEGNSYGGRIGLTPFNTPYTFRKRAIPRFELGFSYLYDVNREGEIEERIAAVDFESNIGPIILRAEYYIRDSNLGADPLAEEDETAPPPVVGTVLDGYHVTGAIDFSNFSSLPVILYCRYDYFRKRDNEEYDIFGYTVRERDVDQPVEEDCVTRIAGGMRINISDILFLKLEYLQFLDTYEEFENRDVYCEKSFFAQLVITF